MKRSYSTDLTEAEWACLDQREMVIESLKADCEVRVGRPES